KEMIEALSESAERLRLAIESSRMGIWDWDILTNQVRWEEHLHHIFGLTQGSFGGTPEAFLNLVNPADSEKIAQAVTSAIEEGAPYNVEFRLRESDGQVRWMASQGQVYRDKTGRAVRMVGVGQDITERKLAEEAMRESEQKFFKTFNANPSPMSISELKSGRVIDVNESFLITFGRTREEVIGRTADDLRTWADPQERETVIEALRQHGSVRSRETRMRMKDGEIRTFLLSVEIIELGSEPCLLMVGVDITEHKKLENQLLQAQKMEAVGRLAGGLAHDFNNWLTPIIGYSQLLVRSLEPSDYRKKEAEEINKAGQRAAMLASQLLAFSRNDAPRMSVLDINEIVSDMGKMLRRLIGEDIEFVTHLAPHLGRVKADRRQIEQVIMNLAINARDAMPRGGSLVIETGNIDFDNSYPQRNITVESGPCVMIAISDTGCGMDTETQARIFEPFFTTKETGRGTGLGMYTVYGIVKQSGGSISVYSEEGRGTTFKIYLPRIIGAEEDQAVQTEVRDLTGQETILLVEDQPEVRGFAAVALRSHGYKVIEAEEGESALRVSEEYTGRIDLVVTDVVMPRMSGTELVSRLLGLRPECRALYISGYTGEAIIHHEGLRPEAPLLHKPFTADAIARLVRETLDSDPP
ncbi:MAG: PAS domain S-box protein, partial [Acidobacteriota bacterium]